ncbi:hypothetical protein CCAND93_120065 [Capnocytophaga canis]|uniref:Uncharacterized protein n=1 Tax=Capnocytophaga canis TaxID=1848903 RepID=A0A0B7ILA8_9FLAO|nr:hypothetical protein CCAND93_120065 [Capnocytophaga canis]
MVNPFENYIPPHEIIKNYLDFLLKKNSFESRDDSLNSKKIWNNIPEDTKSY